MSEQHKLPSGSSEKASKPRRVMYEVSGGGNLVQKPISSADINSDPSLRKSLEVKRLEEAADVLLKAGFTPVEIPSVFSSD